MHLDHQAIESIRELAVAAARDEIVQPGFFPPGKFYLRDKDGSLALKEAPVAPRNYKLNTIDDFTDAVKKFGENEHAVVFCSGCGLVCSLDEDTDRLHRLRMPLTLTDEFQFLQHLRAARAGLKQKSFISLLRIDLARACDVALVDSFRHLKFNKTKDGTSIVKPGNEAMSAELKLEVLIDGKQIPDSCALSIQVYDQVGDVQMQRVNCAIETDLEELTFTLIPLAGELEEAQRKVDEEIRKRVAVLLDGFAPVFCGSCPRLRN